MSRMCIFHFDMSQIARASESADSNEDSNEELSDMIAGRFVCISANLVLRLNELRVVFDLVVFGQQLFGETEVHLGLGRVLFLQCDYASVRVIDELVRPGNSAP